MISKQSLLICLSSWRPLQFIFPASVEHRPHIMPISLQQLGTPKGRKFVLSLEAPELSQSPGLVECSHRSTPIPDLGWQLLGIRWSTLYQGAVTAVNLGNGEVGSLCSDSILQVSLMQRRTPEGLRILQSGKMVVFAAP